jgi:hypothetical protein
MHAHVDDGCRRLGEDFQVTRLVCIQDDWIVPVLRPMISFSHVLFAARHSLFGDETIAFIPPPAPLSWLVTNGN